MTSPLVPLASNELFERPPIVPHNACHFCYMERKARRPLASDQLNYRGAARPAMATSLAFSLWFLKERCARTVEFRWRGRWHATRAGQSQLRKAPSRAHLQRVVGWPVDGTTQRAFLPLAETTQASMRGAWSRLTHVNCQRERRSDPTIEFRWRGR
jgi:hypothetical protein